MDFATLPRWAKPATGESRASWLAATGRLQPMRDHDWLAWVQPSADEPERPQRGAAWINLPSELGDARSVLPIWRLHPRQRTLFCPQCHVDDGGGARRWVVRAGWLDARRLTCEQHAELLVHQSPEFGLDPGYARCMAHPEIQGMICWLRGWCRWDGTRREWQRESLFRRDLVHLAVRNWHQHNEHSAAALIAWELHLWGWDYPQRSPMFTPGEPSRLGVLPPAERVGALLMMYRCWTLFRGISQSETSVRLPPAAWEWFLRRWWWRVCRSDRPRLEELAAQCTDTGQRLAPRRKPSSKLH